jgi:hypothetical protein
MGIAPSFALRAKEQAPPILRATLGREHARWANHQCLHAVIARSTLVRRSPPSGEGGCDEAIHFSCCLTKAGLLRGACQRARVRATRWLAMTADCASLIRPTGYRALAPSLRLHKLRRRLARHLPERVRKRRHAGVAEIGSELLDREVGFHRELFDRRGDARALAPALEA